LSHQKKIDQSINKNEEVIRNKLTSLLEQSIDIAQIEQFKNDYMS